MTQNNVHSMIEINEMTSLVNNLNLGTLLEITQLNNGFSAANVFLIKTTIKKYIVKSFPLSEKMLNSSYKNAKQISQTVSVALPLSFNGVSIYKITRYYVFFEYLENQVKSSADLTETRAYNTGQAFARIALSAPTQKLAEKLQTFIKKQFNRFRKKRRPNWDLALATESPLQDWLKSNFHTISSLSQQSALLAEIFFKLTEIVYTYVDVKLDNLIFQQSKPIFIDFEGSFRLSSPWLLTMMFAIDFAYDVATKSFNVQLFKSFFEGYTDSCNLQKIDANIIIGAYINQVLNVSIYPSIFRFSNTENKQGKENISGVLQKYRTKVELVLQNSNSIKEIFANIQNK